MLRFLVVADDDLTVEDDALSALKANATEVLEVSTTALEAVEDWQAAPIEAALRQALVDGLGIKPRLAFGPARVAVTGRRVSPPLFESMELLGRDSTISRLNALSARLGPAA